MKHSDELKKQVGQTEAKEEAKKILEAAGMILTDDELEMVSGGNHYTVDTGTSQNAVIRSGPGLRFPQVDSIRNDQYVVTIGEPVEDKEKKGRTWYEICIPVNGWIAGDDIKH